MRFVDLDGRDGDITGIVDPRPYLAKLPELAERLPPGARAFATDPGHYAFSGRRCVKDLKPQRVRCLGDGEIEIRFGHNCWKHDEDLVVRYEGVSRFQAAAPMRWRAGRGRWSSCAGTSWLSGWRRTARMRVRADTGVGGPARPWPTLVG